MQRFRRRRPGYPCSQLPHQAVEVVAPPGFEESRRVLECVERISFGKNRSEVSKRYRASVV
jgi:hypothetical protein